MWHVLATNRTEMQINEPSLRTKLKFIFKSHSLLFQKFKKSEPLPFIKKRSHSLPKTNLARNANWRTQNCIIDFSNPKSHSSSHQLAIHPQSQSVSNSKCIVIDAIRSQKRCRSHSWNTMNWSSPHFIPRKTFDFDFVLSGNSRMAFNDCVLWEVLLGYCARGVQTITPWSNEGILQRNYGFWSKRKMSYVWFLLGLKQRIG